MKRWFQRSADSDRGKPTGDLVGHVGKANKLELSGWALSKSREAIQPEVEVVQSDRVILLAVPTLADHKIRPALGLTESTGASLTRWRILFPLAGGLKPDIPFVVRFREDGSRLGAGTRTIPLFGRISDEARGDIEKGVLATYGLEGFDRDVLSISFRIVGNPTTGQLLDILVNDRPVATSQKTAAAGAPGINLGLPSLHLAFELPVRAIVEVPEYATKVGVSTPPSLDPRHAFHHRLRVLHIPRTIWQEQLLVAPLPDQEAMRRVSGNIGPGLFLTGGLTTFMQIDEITQRFFGKRITQFGSVVDWGVGCARVLRHFIESAPRMGHPGDVEQVLHGFDIDSYNIDWCHRHMPAGDYALLDRNGRLPVADQDVDLLYGISVMTHLSEHNQMKWLGEIRRVMRPGGAVVLTIEGEARNYTRYSSLGTAFVEIFGIADMMADPTFGEDPESYYRLTSHARDYVRRVWGEHFEVLDVVPAAMVNQDYVILRA
jgi:ubiquinone/menaquinone biosynthesis C-methylase UbiE